MRLIDRRRLILPVPQRSLRNGAPDGAQNKTLASPYGLAALRKFLRHGRTSDRARGSSAQRSAQGSVAEDNEAQPLIARARPPTFGLLGSIGQW